MKIFLSMTSSHHHQLPSFFFQTYFRITLYWNVTGLSKRGEECWDNVPQFEVVGLGETWVEERSWEKNRKDATEKVQMGRTLGKKRMKKRKSCRGNNNRGEVGD
jgi:hypothetical protein